MNYYKMCLFITCAIAGNALAKDLKLPNDSLLTKIVIRKGDSGWLAVKWIENPNQLKAIGEFLNKNQGGWTESPFGSSPSSLLALDLFSGTNYIERIGIGEDYLVCGSLEKVSPRQVQELRRLIGKIPATLEEVVLPAISGIKEIVVITNMNGEVNRRITNHQDIDRIVDFINQHRTGWSEQWQGTSKPNFILDLEDQTGFVVEFGVGDDFLETCGDGMFTGCRSKKVSRDQKDKMLGLLKLP